jgi:hypothetical protein
MASMLNKGKRLQRKKQLKENKHIMRVFNETLDQMNKVASILDQDPTLNEENFDAKLKEASDYEFTGKQVQMMKDKILYDL